jgi:hypothetical protein
MGSLVRMSWGAMTRRLGGRGRSPDISDNGRAQARLAAQTP